MISIERLTLSDIAVRHDLLGMELRAQLPDPRDAAYWAATMTKSTASREEVDAFIRWLSVAPSRMDELLKLLGLDEALSTRTPPP